MYPATVEVVRNIKDCPWISYPTSMDVNVTTRITVTEDGQYSFFVFISTSSGEEILYKCGTGQLIWKHCYVIRWKTDSGDSLPEQLIHDYEDHVNRVLSEVITCTQHN